MQMQIIPKKMWEILKLFITMMTDVYMRNIPTLYIQQSC